MKYPCTNAIYDIKVGYKKNKDNVNTYTVSSHKVTLDIYKSDKEWK